MCGCVDVWMCGCVDMCVCVCVCVWYVRVKFFVLILFTLYIHVMRMRRGGRAASSHRARRGGLWARSLVVSPLHGVPVVANRRPKFLRALSSQRYSSLGNDFSVIVHLFSVHVFFVLFFLNFSCSPPHPFHVLVFLNCFFVPFSFLL
jgi:hypothetical protein